MFGPGNIGGGRDDSKPMAPANAKVEAKVNREGLPTPEEDEARREKEKEEAEQLKRQPVADSGKNIWAEEEIKEIVLPKKDDRLQPEYDIKFKQTVGASDLFLGLSDMDPTSMKCQCLLMTIMIPDTKFSEVQLEVTKQNVIVQSPSYFLNHTLPYEVNSKEGSAKWISDKYTLELSLPIIRPEPF